MGGMLAERTVPALYRKSMQHPSARSNCLLWEFHFISRRLTWNLKYRIFLMSRGLGSTGVGGLTGGSDGRDTGRVGTKSRLRSLQEENQAQCRA